MNTPEAFRYHAGGYAEWIIFIWITIDAIALNWGGGSLANAPAKSGLAVFSAETLTTIAAES